MNIEEFLVQPGDPIQPVWERLQKWLETLEVRTAGDGARIHYSPRQIDVVYEPDPVVFTPAFAIKINDADLSATIGEGYVNNIMPTIGDAKITGEQDDGAAGEPPTLDLSDGPNEELHSWICIRAVVDLGTGKLVTQGIEPPIGVEHTNALPDLRDGGVKDIGGHGLYPLALLRWTEARDGITEVHQIVMHDLQHRFVRAKAIAGGRHFFFV